MVFRVWYLNPVHFQIRILIIPPWYEGFILGYDAATRLHEIAYVEKDDNFHYNLVDDFVSEDLKFDD